MHILRLHKPDGRQLLLYARDARGPIPPGTAAPQPEGDPPVPSPHLRWHPLRGEWVAYASHRQNRTFLPPPEYNPLAPTRPGAPPTELPAGPYDVAVFENRFPTLTPRAGDPPAGLPVPTARGTGACEVVVFTQDPTSSLGRLPLDHLELLLEVWGHRTAELGAREDVLHVLPFENRGVEVGVTLHHPHGQIYAYPFVPPLQQREIAQQRAFYAEHGRTLLGALLDAELADGRRVLYEGAAAAAFVPSWARYPYEVCVVPRRATARLDQLDAGQRSDLARALKTALLKYDGLWGRPFPYLLAFQQAPTDGAEHPAAHLRIELSPAYRSRDRLKFLAGTELAAEMFSNDSVPEEKAAELRAVEVRVDD